MSYEEKVMESSYSSANIMIPTSQLLNFSEVNSSSIEPPQVPSQQSGVLDGPVAILWDIENCPVPSDVRSEEVAGNIRMALRVHPVVKGAVTMFSAFGDFNAFPRRLREGCQRTGVKLVDVPNGRKDAADKAILVDMFLFALDNRPPSSILLISGDVDFAPALHILGQRGYTIILAIPSGVGVSSALSNAGRFVWDWPSVARGEGFVPLNTCMPQRYDAAGYLESCNIGGNLESQNEEESIIYKAISQSEHSYHPNINQVYCYNSSHISREVTSLSEYSGHNIKAGPFSTSSRSQNLPYALSVAPLGDQNDTQDQSWWVQPGDIQGLKGQLVRLLEIFGGNLPLMRVPAEYMRLYGRPLYKAEYGVYKLVNLVNKMFDAFVVVGKGAKKVLCLRDSNDKHLKKCPSSPAMLRKDKKGKGALGENADTGAGPVIGNSSSDDLSDEEKASYDLSDRLNSFKLEAQELLVCYSSPVPLGSFQALYEQRYKKPLDYQYFGTEGLEELIEKIGDVLQLWEDPMSKMKSLLSTYVSHHS